MCNGFVQIWSATPICLNVNHAWFGLPVPVLSSAQLLSLRFASVPSLAQMSSASLHGRTWSEIHGRKNFVYCLKCFFPYEAAYSMCQFGAELYPVWEHAFTAVSFEILAF